MAIMDGPLWTYNLARVIVLDVSDDYALMQPPLPNECYPVVSEEWIPRHHLPKVFKEGTLVEGFLYDWHQAPIYKGDCWYVGVVNSELVDYLMSQSHANVPLITA